MTETQKQPITLIGAGLTGCFLAILFAKRGFEVHIYERSTREEIMNAAEERSFNLTFYNYALDAFHKAGVWEALEPSFLRLRGSVTQVMPRQLGKPIVSLFDADLPYYTVKRAALLEALILEAEKSPNIHFHFEHALRDINRHKKTITVENLATKTMSEQHVPVVFGTDGVHSLVRTFIQEGQLSTHELEYASWGYKQVAMRKESAEKLKLANDLTHTWTGKNGAFLTFPNSDHSVSAFLTMDMEGLRTLNTPNRIEAFFRNNFPDLLPVLSDIIDSLMKYPEGRFITMKTAPWHADDFLALVGDSAHGFFPFFGHGISAAFADSLELMQLIDRFGTDWGQIFPLYTKHRKPQTDALAELSKEAFIRYRRSSRGDYRTIYDRVDSLLHSLFPRLFHPALFVHVASDSGHSAEIVKLHEKQRLLTNLLGVPVFVFLLSGTLLSFEKTRGFFHRFFSLPKSI